MTLSKKNGVSTNVAPKTSRERGRKRRKRRHSENVDKK